MRGKTIYEEGIYKESITKKKYELEGELRKI